MASNTATETTHHPAPHRERVGLPALLFGFAGAPLAWSGQTIVNYFLAGHSCYPGSIPRTTLLEGWSWAAPTGIAINVLAILIALAAGFVSYRAWMLTREEHHGGSEHLMEVGEGRSRFLAYSGLLTSGGFLVAIVFAASSFWVPLCGH